MALTTYPAHYPARQALVSALTEEGLTPEANSNAAVLKAVTQPSVCGVARFHNGMELLGITIGEGKGEACRRGQSLPISYYWKSPVGADPEQWAVFVHVKQGNSKFQDDHVLLAETPLESIRYQPFPEIFIERRNVTIPATTVPGGYQVWIGMLDRKSGKSV